MLLVALFGGHLPHYFLTSFEFSIGSFRFILLGLPLFQSNLWPKALIACSPIDELSNNLFGPTVNMFNSRSLMSSLCLSCSALVSLIACSVKLTCHNK